MMKTKPLSSICLLLLIFPTLVAQGCTYQAWYEGFKERERQECYKHPDNSDVESCLERVNNLSYEQYKKSRSSQ